MQEKKTYWMSAGVGSNPFAKTSGFTQPADQTKAVSGFAGNIDFEQESMRTSFRKSVGKDLNLGNPYLGREVSVTNFSDITKRVVDACRAKSAANGLRGLRIALRKVDKDNNGMIEPMLFKFGLREYGIEISEEEMASLLKFFDSSKCGKLSINEMLHAMRSNSFTASREAVVEQAYNKLDRSGAQKVTLTDLEANYDITPNP